MIKMEVQHDFFGYVKPLASASDEVGGNVIGTITDLMSSEVKNYFLGH